MERIDGGPGQFLFRPDVPHETEKKTKKKGETRKKSGFFSLVSRPDEHELESFDLLPSELKASIQAAPSLDAWLSGTIDTIHTHGDALAKYPSRENLALYRRAVSDFLKVIAKRTYRAEDNLGHRSLVDQKKYTVIKLVDQRLEKLALGILQEQRGNLQILAQIEEINGMLFDLLQ
ncbi:YaaR family protein [Spirochaeta lutea]|uniref:DUF327 domain-containing protein n=1 Tax=Spirochaeta lutea TaxID=1480694 RepID=A0A098R1S9_9SPIO|nr:YaaR family protein [Spirochaeta lutea]KGE73628.1 hypothetical protein DC28_03030 [Spirochaeta lutea]